MFIKYIIAFKGITIKSAESISEDKPFESCDDFFFVPVKCVATDGIPWQGKGISANEHILQKHSSTFSDLLGINTKYYHAEEKLQLACMPPFPS